MWQAVMERNKALDGKFVYAVKTTKVYCRPTCPSRRPNHENVEFFDAPEAAKRKGYRACARCKPDAGVTKAEELVMKVREYIEENLGSEKSLKLETIAKSVGASPFHLQKVFKSQVGLSPRQYAEELKLRNVKQQLKSGRDVTSAVYEAGYSSSSRLYERSTQNLGMTPRAYAKGGKGELISFALVSSPLGLMIMAGTKKGLCFLRFGESEAQLKEALVTEFSAAMLVENAEALSSWIENLALYFQGRCEFDVPVDMRGTDFQQRVWRYLRQIPPGETRTYTQVAEALGIPTAVRAVARACATNRVGIAIPCHRVIRQDGSLAGYAWGIERKEALIVLERKQSG